MVWGRAIMSAIPVVGQERELRSSLQARLTDARKHTDSLFQLVREEALYDRPIRERHRLIFYIGHLEAFDWNLIGKDALGRSSGREAFDQLFAFGMDPPGCDLPTDQPSDLPSMDEGYIFREQTRRAVDQCIAAVDDTERLNVALEHRLMHDETLAYLLHRMPLNRKETISQEIFWTHRGPEARPIDIPAGSATLGLEPGAEFGWDNEFARHTVCVPAFSIGKLNVTNRDFLAFVAAGGYAERSLWSDAGWAWIQRDGIVHPGFWIEVGDGRRGDSYRYRQMFAEAPLPLDWPAYVSHAEASAYARWKGKSLPTEAQFHRAAYGRRDDLESPYPWGHKYPEQVSGNFDFRSWDPAPVGAYPDTNSAFGVSDLVGNGWEWTSTPFSPFEGFQAFPFYPGYSADFFDGKHYVMKGGSARTAACMLRSSFRNWFQPHYPHVYATFRLVDN